MRIFRNILIAYFSLLCGACADYLDIAPDNIATIDYAFRTRASAERFLATCYSDLPSIGDPANDPAIMGSDEVWNYYSLGEGTGTGSFAAYNIKLGMQNANDPYMNYWDGSRQGKNLWKGIRNCNIFIDNINQVGLELSGDERDRWVAEVKFIKAYLHYYLMRMYGPIPLMRTNYSVEVSTEEVRVYRDTWDDCVNYVIQLIDEAVPYLPLYIEQRATEMGRITQAIALAIKAEILVTSASPLFNGNEEYKDLADNRGVRIFSQEYDEEKWKRAAVACKNAIDTCLLAGHKLYKFTEPYVMSDSTRLVNTLRCVFSTRYNEEMIWGMTKYTVKNYEYHTLPYFEQNMQNTIPWRPLIAPAMRMAELYYSNNGVPIEEDKNYDYNHRFDVDVASDNHYYYIQHGFRTAKLHMNREARFYANLAFDGSWWWGNGRYQDVGTTPVTSAPWPMRMKQNETMGKQGSLRYSITGYWAKKPSHFETYVKSSGGGDQYRFSFPIIRLADLYLLYAEALNESNSAPTDEIYKYVDEVRKRAGLKGVLESWKNYSNIPNKPTTQEGMREIIQRERMIELSFEGKRFWDLRRWKLAQSVIPGTIKSWNIEARDEKEYYRVISIDDIDFSAKEYLWPIKIHSLRVNTNLVQNPYWN